MGSGGPGGEEPGVGQTENTTGSTLQELGVSERPWGLTLTKEAPGPVEGTCVLCAQASGLEDH